MEREDAVKIAVAVGGVVLFVAALAVVGMRYGSGESIQSNGALPLLGAITLFIVAMGVAGFWLAERDK